MGPALRHRGGARMAAIVAAAALVFGPSCGGRETPAQGAPPLPPPPPRIDLTMREMGFSYARNIPRGRVLFQVRNAGRRVHRVALVYLPENTPPILSQLRGTERLVVDELASVPNRPPGAEDSFAVDLDPGRWAFLCLVIDPDGKSHAEKGMASEFIVRGNREDPSK